MKIGSKRSILSATLAMVLTGSFGAIAAESKDSEIPSWEVSKPQGEVKNVTIDTTESTWSNLDVHPNGKTIIFDMLGDIYTMPITGGEATPLVKGYDWNMQATYSPDGSKIAFLSDRDGMINVWVMNADGSNPVQITKENNNTIHTPTWSPDGQYIAVTRGVMSDHQARDENVGGEVLCRVF